MVGSCFIAMPSYREPFGLVALEAMAAGKPVLATPVGGLPEFADTPVNRLVPAQEELWIQALEDLLDDQRDGRDCQTVLENRQAVVNHHWEIVANRYLEIFSSASNDQNEIK
jgi:glycosyltransferase involved in cell wall biosynthesis